MEPTAMRSGAMAGTSPGAWPVSMRSHGRAAGPSGLARGPRTTVRSSPADVWVNHPWAIVALWVVPKNRLASSDGGREDPEARVEQRTGKLAPVHHAVSILEATSRAALAASR